MYAGMGSNAMLVINDMGELLMYGGEAEESPTVVASFWRMHVAVYYKT